MRMLLVVLALYSGCSLTDPEPMVPSGGPDAILYVPPRWGYLYVPSTTPATVVPCGTPDGHLWICYSATEDPAAFDLHLQTATRCWIGRTQTYVIEPNVMYRLEVRNFSSIGGLSTVIHKETPPISTSPIQYENHRSHSLTNDPAISIVIAPRTTYAGQTSGTTFLLTLRHGTWQVDLALEFAP